MGHANSNELNELDRARSVVDLLERLAREAHCERQAIGYPERCRKISYSQNVRQLASEALLNGFSSFIIASAAGVQVQTVDKWSKAKQAAPFRELRIVPSANRASESQESRADFKSQEHTSNSDKRALEFIFPSGARLLISRSDLDESLLGMLVRGIGGNL